MRPKNKSEQADHGNDVNALFQGTSGNRRVLMQKKYAPVSNRRSLPPQAGGRKDEICVRARNPPGEAVEFPPEQP